MEASQLESLVDEAPAVSFPFGFGDDLRGAEILPRDEGSANIREGTHGQRHGDRSKACHMPGGITWNNHPLTSIHQLFGVPRGLGYLGFDP